MTEVGLHENQEPACVPLGGGQWPRSSGRPHWDLQGHQNRLQESKEPGSSPRGFWAMVRLGHPSWGPQRVGVLGLPSG